MPEHLCITSYEHDQDVNEYNWVQGNVVSRKLINICIMFSGSPCDDFFFTYNCHPHISF